MGFQSTILSIRWLVLCERCFFFIYSEAFTVVTLSRSVHIDSSILSVHFVAHLPHRRIYLYQEFGGVLKVSGRAHLVYK